MKLFLREHALLVVLQCVQLLFIGLIFWLDGYRSWRMLAYACFVGLFCLLMYLIYMYIRRRSTYTRLQSGFVNLDESLEEIGNAPLSQALDALLKKQYRLYEAELQTEKSRQADHLLFMDRWVHQMKTPLSVVELTAQTLDEPESSNLREETERMKTGLETVLYMARLRTIAEDFHIAPVNLTHLVNEVNQDNKRFYIRNEVYPHLEAKRNDITVESDEKWLFFMLSQLVHNAVKYSKGKSNRIHMRIYERKRSAILEIQDYGVGIPAEDRKRVFDKFYTGANGRTFRESTGMGLYLVKEVAAELGHTIELSSEVGVGTIFRICFTPSQNLTKM